jgi:hypothetical protein
MTIDYNSYCLFDYCFNVFIIFNNIILILILMIMIIRSEILIRCT